MIHLSRSVRPWQAVSLVFSLCAVALGGVRTAAAQTAVARAAANQPTNSRTVGPRERLVLFNVPFYGRGANSVEPGDSLIGPLTTSRLRANLERSGRFELIDSARVATALAAAETNGIRCDTQECQRQVAERLGAKWMVTAKFSKLSNLIWFLSGQLTEVPTGRRALDNEFELKGVIDDMSRGGALALARRIVKAADSGVTKAASR